MKHLSLAFIFILVTTVLAQAALSVENKQTEYAGMPTYDDKLESLRAKVRDNVDSADARFELARALSFPGHYDEALEHFQQALRLNPSSAETYFFLGIAYSDLDRPVEEIEAYNRAVEINPGYYTAHFNSGLVYDELGRHEEAIEAYKRAAQTNDSTDNGYDYLYLAQDFLRLGRNKEARKAFKTAVQKRPDLKKTEIWRLTLTPGLDSNLLLSLMN